MTGYPAAPPGWAVDDRRRVGPFTVSVVFAHPDGRRSAWTSRSHRKHASRLSRVRRTGESVWWAPHRASWWIAVLFSIGSLCFLVAPLAWYLHAVGAKADGRTFFVGSLFFTCAAFLQWLETVNADQQPGTARRSIRWVAWQPRRIDFWSSGVQLLGTLFFNATTFRALSTAVDTPSYNQVVWRPDAYGSVCFLVSGYLAYVEVTGRLLGRTPRTFEGAVVAVNLVGCVAFAVSAVASYVVPTTGSAVSVAAANAMTCLGAACFLVGALLLLPEGARQTAAEA